MHHVPDHLLRSGFLALTYSLLQGPALAGGADDVSLVVKDDGFMQAWSTAPHNLHDAATPAANRPAVTERTKQTPPRAIVEHAPVKQPTAEATWVRGFWRWDPAAGDFTWVSGFWATPPPNSFWVDGSWKRDDQGWYRVPGFWSARRTPAAPVVSNPAAVPADGAPAVVGPIDPAGDSRPAPTSARRVALTQYPAADRETVSVEPLPTPEVPAAELPAPVAGAPAVAASPQVVATAPAAVATAPTPTVVTTAPAPAVVAGPSPVIALADQLAGQAAAFEQVFGRTAGVTPGGGAFLAEARRLRGAALGLRQAAASGNAYQTAMASRDINSTWQRMAARVNQIAPGRTGPNIQQIWRMGATAAEIARQAP